MPTLSDNMSTHRAVTLRKAYCPRYISVRSLPSYLGGQPRDATSYIPDSFSLSVLTHKFAPSRIVRSMYDNG